MNSTYDALDLDLAAVEVCDGLREAVCLCKGSNDLDFLVRIAMVRKNMYTLRQHVNNPTAETKLKHSFVISD